MREAIKAQVLLCFMALMMSKFLEIKTGLSINRIRDILWNVREVHIVDTITKKRSPCKPIWTSLKKQTWQKSFYHNKWLCQEILNGHFQATFTRFSATKGLILILQDTTEFSYK